MVLGFIIQIPGTAREVIEPRMMQDIYKCSMKEHLNEYFIKPMFHTAYLMPFLIGGIFFYFARNHSIAASEVYKRNTVVQIVVFGSYFVAMSYTARGSYRGLPMAIARIVYNVICITGKRCRQHIFIKNGLGIKGVAVGQPLLLRYVHRPGCFVKISSNHSIQNWGKKHHRFIVSVSYYGRINSVFRVYQPKYSNGRLPLRIFRRVPGGRY